MKHNVYKWRNLDGLWTFAQSWAPDWAPRGTICLIHGLGDHGGRFAHVGAALAAGGFATLAADMRGHGKTEGPRGHAPSYRYILHDITRLLEEAEKSFPQLPRFLYGHSMGGSQVLYHSLCRRRSLAGVIATGPALHPGFEPPPWKLRLGKALDRLWPALRLSNEIDVNEVSSDPEVVEAYRNDPLVHDRISVRWFNEWRKSVDYVESHAVEMTWPVLLMHGSLDKLTSPAATIELSEKIGRNGTLKIWEGFKHEIHNEPKKEEVFAYTLDWLRRQI